MLFSVIIVNYNGGNLLLNSIKSIMENIDFKKNKYEIIVIDNNSSDSSMKKLDNYVKKTNLEFLVKTKNLDKNYGFAKANNKGVEISKGKYLLFINNDTLVYDFDFNDFFSKYQSLAPAIIAPKLLNDDLTIQRSNFHFPNLFKLILESLGIKTIIKLFTKYFGIKMKIEKTGTKSDLKKVQYVSGACFFIEKEIYNKLGGFDEEYYFYHEECDLMYRANQQNINCYIDLENSIIHYGGGNKPFTKMKYINYYKSLLIYFRKNKNQEFLPKIIILLGIYLRKILLDLGLEFFIDPITVYNKKESKLSKNEIKSIYISVIDKLKEGV